MFEQLPEGHIIKTMVKEHEHILAMLDELQEITLQLSGDDQNNGRAFQTTWYMSEIPHCGEC